MKKRLILFTAILSIAVIFAGCGFQNMEMPQTVSIKTDAVYEFPILDLSSPAMQKKLDLSSLLDFEKLLSSEDESESKFKIYKYNDGSKYQQYLLHMPLANLDFDFSKSFGDMDFSTIMQEGFSIDKEIEIPTVGNINENKPLDLSNINTVLNGGISFIGDTPLSGNDLTVQFADVPGTSFEYIEYKNGSFIVDASYDPLGRTAQGKLTLIYKDGVNPEKILSSGTFKDNKATIDISNQKIYKTGMYLRYEGSTPTVGFIATVSEGSQIAMAKAVTLPDTSFNVPDVKVTIPFSMEEDLGDVTINDGSLTVAIDDTWKADDPVINDYQITVSGGLNCSVSKTEPTAQLVNAKIKSEDIEATAHVTVYIHNADINFNEPPQVNVKTEINEVTASVTMPDDFKTSISQNVDLPEDLKKFVNWITWKEIGFDVVANNTLPKENDISIKIWSDALGIPEGTPQTIVAGAENSEPLSFKNASESTTILNGTGAISSIDINGEIGLPGAEAGKLIVQHVKPGDKYSVSLTITPKFEFKEANIKMPENTNFSGDFNTSINKKAMFKDLGSDVADALENIQIRTLPLYLYANVPDILGDDSGFAGTIKTYYGKEKDDGTIEQISTDDEVNWILDDYDEETKVHKAKKIEFVQMPELTTNEDGEVDAQLGKELIEIASALNSSPTGAGAEDSTLCISYNVGLQGTQDDSITLKGEDLERLKNAGSTSISVDVVLLLNLNFTLKDPIELDLMEFINKEEEDDSNTSGTDTGSTTKTDQERDLLNREEATDTASYEKYLEAVKTASLIIEKTELPLAGTIQLQIDMYNEPNNIQTIDFGNGKDTTIEINPSKFISTYPLEPQIKLIIGEGQNSTFGLLRNVKVSGKIKAKVVANKDKPIQIYPFSEQNNGGND